MTATISITEAWRQVLDDLGTLGATDQTYDYPPRPDWHLWHRAARIYNTTAWRGAAAGTRTLPGKPVPAVLTVLRRAYQAGRGPALIPMELLATRVRAMGHDSAYVDYTAGECATLYVGPTRRDENGVDRYAAAAGPGTFASQWFGEPYAHPADFVVGRDDEGSADHRVPPGATVDGIVELIDLQVKASVAIAVVDRAALQLRKHGVTWGQALDDEQCEALQQREPSAAGGDADWKVAVYLYELTGPLPTRAGEISAGTYLRIVEGKTVRAYAATGDARGYVEAIEAEYHLDVPNRR